MDKTPQEKARGQRLKKESKDRTRRAISISALAIFVAGMAFVALFNVVLDWTNKESFCISCHEMEDNVYREYQLSRHYYTRSGVRPVCADCHVPKEFFPKIVRKIKAANELWHKMLGTIDTPEKFAEKRAELAQNEWRRMKDNDSQECRNCHDANYFSFSMQGYRAEAQHNDGLKKGQTCIDCHKGIAHNMPPGIPPEVLHPPLPPVAQTPESPQENPAKPQD